MKVLKPEQMPVDSDGNRADVICDPNSTISRMNLSRLYEHYMNSCSRDVRKKIRALLGLADKQKVSAQDLSTYSSDVINDIWEYLKGYYKIISPKRMYEGFALKLAPDQVLEHLATCINEWVYVYFPPENETEDILMVKALEDYVAPTYGVVSYIGNNGKRIFTKEKIRIASMYFMLLEKTGDDWTAVSSAKLQNYGVLSQITNSDKYSYPTRQQAIRAFGEAEVRILRSNTEDVATAEIMDRNNNPEAHYAVLESILTALNPADIEDAVDRNKIGLNGSKPLKLFRHFAYTSGWRMQKKAHDPSKNLFGK